jgi:hypothetical protein
MTVLRLAIGSLALAGALSITGAYGTVVTSTAPVAQVVSTATLDAPTGLGATRGVCVPMSAPYVDLSWVPTGSPFADGYVILRSLVPGSGYVAIGTTSGRATTTFTDATVGFLVTYHYVVRATKLIWSSPDSNPASVTAPTPLCT